MLRKQLLLAHRGYSAIAPENTKLAFDAAVAFGFDGFELDVHLTKDGHLVIIHDETTERTALVKRTIAKTELKLLKKDDHSAFFEISVPKQVIMTLEEFLNRYLHLVNVINIEVKTDLIHYKGIEKKIVSLLNKYPAAKAKIVLSSFNFKSLEMLYNLDPKLKLAFLWWTHRQWEKVDQKKLKKICKYLNPWSQIYDKHKQEYKIMEKQFCLWTIKSEQKYHEYKEDEDVKMQISNYKYLDK